MKKETYICDTCGVTREGWDPESEWLTKRLHVVVGTGAELLTGKHEESNRVIHVCSTACGEKFDALPIGTQIASGSVEEVDADDRISPADILRDLRGGRSRENELLDSFKRMFDSLEKLK